MPSLGDFTEFDQAVSEAEKVEPDTFVFYGEMFTVAEQVSSIPMMRLAKVAASGGDSSDIEGLVALNDFLEQTLADGEFLRFCDVATRNKVSDEALLKVAQRVYEAIAARPTRRQSSSSGGLPSTSPSSKPTSSAMANAGLSPDDMASPEESVRLLTGAA